MVCVCHKTVAELVLWLVSSKREEIFQSLGNGCLVFSRLVSVSTLSCSLRIALVSWPVDKVVWSTTSARASGLGSSRVRLVALRMLMSEVTWNHEGRWRPK